MVKKLFSVLILVSVLAVLALPLTASAQGPQECCKMRRTVTLETGNECLKDTVVKPAANATCTLAGTSCVKAAWGVFCTINAINIVVDIIFFILLAISVLMGILGAIQLVTAAGDPSKISTGRNYIMYAVIGLVIGMIVRVIPSLARVALGF